MQKNISEKINLLRPILALLVILIHSERAFRLYIKPTDKMKYVIAACQGNICRIAVPMFFVISGYLFFYYHSVGNSKYLPFIFKKAKRILLPYIFINMFLVIVCCFMNLPGISSKITWETLDIMKHFGLLQGSVPISYPLWFLRDLFIVFILSPLLIIVFKEVPLTGVGLTVFLWMTVNRIGLVNFEAVAWFYLGGGIYYYKMNGKRLPDTKVFTNIVFVSFILNVYILCIVKVREMTFPYYRYLYNFNLFLGMICFWKLADTRLINNRFIRFFAPVNFFIYLWQEPLLSYLQYRICKNRIISGTFEQILFYFSSCGITFLLLGAIGIIQKKVVKRLNDTFKI